MLPSWIIEEMARVRREREAREERDRPRLWIEEPVHVPRREPSEPEASGSTVIQIQIG